jgi:hypothetical protein
LYILPKAYIFGSDARMRIAYETWISAIWLGVLVLTGLTIVIDVSHSPLPLMLSIGAAARPWFQGWKAAQGTSLRGALVWAGLALLLAFLAQVIGSGEPVGSGQPWTGRLTYLTVLAILAALISVFGARTPGSGAWAILMVLLVVVMLIPWLEAAGRLRREAGLGLVRLDSPWSLFYVLLVIGGVTNYLPTRYGPAAAMLGAGLLAEYLVLTRTDWTDLARARIWEFTGWTLAASAWCVEQCAPRTLSGRTDLERLWFSFRDHWGVVWGLRTRDRFNRSAELAGWPLRLTWFGLAPASSASAQTESEGPVPRQAEATLRNLIRRFVTSERIDALLLDKRGQTCDPEELAR